MEATDNHTSSSTETSNSLSPPSNVKIDESCMEFTTAKLPWDKLGGVFVTRHEKNPIIVFVNEEAVIICHVDYSPELWKQILNVKSSIFWRHGPEVIPGFGTSSIWYKPGLMVHTQNQIQVSFGTPNSIFRVNQLDHCNFGYKVSL